MDVVINTTLIKNTIGIPEVVVSRVRTQPIVCDLIYHEKVAAYRPALWALYTIGHASLHGAGGRAATLLAKSELYTLD